MKIAQFHDPQGVHLGLIENDLLFPLTFNGRMLDLIQIDSRIKKANKTPIALEQVHWAPVIQNPSKIMAIGLNYMDHIRESKGEIPKTPVVFAKFPNSLIGHKQAIIWDPHATCKVDFEAELAVIIGKTTRHCPEEKALDAVFGYTCANDVSARDLQFGDKQWVRGKSLDTFCPLGPWIVTKDELPAPQQLKIQCRVNDQIMQNSCTDQMIFTVPRLISFLSYYFTLLPGDVLLTGTPHGVGAFRNPAVYLKNGDEVAIEIEGLGILVNTCRVEDRK